MALSLFDVLQFFLSPQVKRYVIVTYKHGIFELPHELPNNWSAFAHTTKNKKI